VLKAEKSTIWNYKILKSAFLRLKLDK